MEADEYLKRKIDYLNNNCERLEANIHDKRKNLEVCCSVSVAVSLSRVLS